MAGEFLRRSFLVVGLFLSQYLLAISADDVDVLQPMQKPIFDLDLSGDPVPLDKFVGLAHFASRIRGLNLMETCLQDDLFGPPLWNAHNRQ